MRLKGSEGEENEFSVTEELKRRLAGQIEKVRKGDSDGGEAAQTVNELTHIVSLHNDLLPGEKRPQSRFMRILKGH